MAMLARLEAGNEYANRRRTNRRLLSLQVPGAIAAGPGVDVFIHDLSLTGLLIETWESLVVGMRIEVDLPEIGKTEAQVVWSTGHYFGCQFETAIPAAALSAAMLRNPIGAQRTAAASAAPASAPLVRTEGDDREGLSLGARMRLIIALATATWGAIFLALTLA